MSDIEHESDDVSVDITESELDVLEEEAEAEEEHGGQSDAEPEPEALAPSEQEVWDDRLAKLAKPWAVWAGKVTAVCEEDAQYLVECPLCADLVHGFVDVRTAGRQHETVKRGIQDFLGIQQEADYNFDPDCIECPRCGGRGETRTHSKVPLQAKRVCKECRGAGFIDKAGGVANGGGYDLAPVTAAVSTENLAPEGESDPFGHPRLLPDGMPNPNYGKFPQYVDPRFP